MRAVAPVHPDILRQALRNLIDNALVYGGSAALAVETSGDAVVVSVRDAGPGVPPDQLEAVLAPFFRLEGSRNRATGGSGLGLAIARSIA